MSSGRGRRRTARRGLTVLETCAVISVIGVILAIAIPAFVRELRRSKTSEAAEQLANLHRGAAAYFAATHEAEDGSRLGRCLPPGAGPSPRRPTAEPETVPFTDPETPGADTWEALGFSPDYPTRYAYTYEPVSFGCDLRAAEGTYLVTFRAEGDLDEDGERSVFERRATATDGGELVPFGVLYVRDRVE